MRSLPRSTPTPPGGWLSNTSPSIRDVTPSWFMRFLAAIVEAIHKFLGNN